MNLFCVNFAFQVSNNHFRIFFNIIGVIILSHLLKIYDKGVNFFYDVSVFGLGCKLHNIVDLLRALLIESNKLVFGVFLNLFISFLHLLQFVKSNINVIHHLCVLLLKTFFKVINIHCAEFLHEIFTSFHEILVGKFIHNVDNSHYFTKLSKLVRQNLNLIKIFWFCIDKFYFVRWRPFLFFQNL